MQVLGARWHAEWAARRRANVSPTAFGGGQQLLSLQRIASRTSTKAYATEYAKAATGRNPPHLRTCPGVAVQDEAALALPPPPL